MQLLRQLPIAILLYLFLVGVACAGTRGVINASDVILQYDPSLEAAARDAVALFPGAKDALLRVMPWPLDFTPTILLVKESDFIQLVGRNPRIVAVAAPEKQLIIIDRSRMKDDSSALTSIVKHELCHLQLHQHISKARLPRWLDEGYCQWISDGVAEVFVDGRPAQIDQAVLAGRLIPLKDLDSGFPSDDGALMLAYEQSKSMVEYIVKQYGVSSLLAILENLKAGQPVDEAIDRALPCSAAELEQRWRRDLKGRVGWFSYFSNYIYEIVFLLGALATVYGFARLMYRIRKYRDEPEDDREQPGDAGPRPE